MSDNVLAIARTVIELEIGEASRLISRLDAEFIRAAELILQCSGKVVVSGIGKSGHIGKKLAATFASTGTPAFFVHPAEALHGDLGMISRGDLVLFISYSGNAKELELILPRLEENDIAVIALTGQRHSVLGNAASAVLNISVEREACPIHLAPTSSAVNTLIMGDALAMAVMETRGFTAEDFARSHPAGSLGSRLLTRVHHVMRSGAELPAIGENGDVMAAMLELSRTGMGLVAVCNDAQQIVGVFTDGDLRRWLVNGGSLQDSVLTAMTRSGFTLTRDLHATNAKEFLLQNRISAAPVVDDAGRLEGVINLQDLYKAGFI